MSFTLFKASFLLWLNHPHVNRICSFWRSSFRGFFLLSLLKRKWESLKQTILAEHPHQEWSQWSVEQYLTNEIGIYLSQREEEVQQRKYSVVCVWLSVLPCVWQKVYKGDREWCRPERQGRLPRISRAKLASGSLFVSQASKIAWRWHNVWKMTEENGGRELHRWVTESYKKETSLLWFILNLAKNKMFLIFYLLQKSSKRSHYDEMHIWGRQKQQSLNLGFLSHLNLCIAKQNCSHPPRPQHWTVQTIYIQRTPSSQYSPLQLWILGGCDDLGLELQGYCLWCWFPLDWGKYSLGASC